MSSLSAMALRLTACQLLNNATFAGDQVHDSAIAPIDDMVENESNEPFIVVSSEDETAMSIPGRDVTGGDRTVDIVIEIGIAHRVVVPAVPAVEGEDGEDEIPATVETVIPATDEGLEVSLTLISRQVMRALFEQKDSPWAVIFKRFCLKVEKISNRRGVGNKDGARFAARQIILTIDCLQEPHFGHEPEAGEPWGDFLAQVLAVPDIAPLEPLIRATITGKPEIEAWDRGRAHQGLTDEATAAIGTGSPLGIPEETPLVNEGTLTDVP